MGVGSVWSRALVYFGIVEEDEYWDEEAYAAEEDLERTYSDRESANVRRLSPRRGGPEFEDWSEPESATGRTAVLRPTGRRPLEAVASASVRVHLVVPGVVRGDPVVPQTRRLGDARLRVDDSVDRRAVGADSEAVRDVELADPHRALAAERVHDLERQLRVPGPHAAVVAVELWCQRWDPGE